uniref:Uncharacterized protein n=1 Tax=Lepeophtheirus salmonis TaxID=72036 RepID=A0A0K2UFM9_LEPSM
MESKDRDECQPLNFHHIPFSIRQRSYVQDIIRRSSSAKIQQQQHDSKSPGSNKPTNKRLLLRSRSAFIAPVSTESPKHWIKGFIGHTLRMDLVDK